MGNGIAQVCAVAGLGVTMVRRLGCRDKTRTFSTSTADLDRLVKKEKMAAPDREAALARINATTDKARLVDCDLVIEAATENEELKVKILKDLCASLPRRRLLLPILRPSRLQNSPPQRIVQTGSSECISSIRYPSWRCWN